MLFAGTPLNQARAAIVQDLYRLAFVCQLEASRADSPYANEPIGDGGGLAEPHAAAFDHRIGAVRALEVAAALRLQVGHAAALEVALVVDPAARRGHGVRRRQPCRRV